jgi:hypothetical protein
MMTSDQSQWIYIADFPKQPDPHDLKEFFGIPPSPDTDEQLTKNIRRKRTTWHTKTNKGSEEGRRHAEMVMSAIDEAEDSLKRGATATGSSAGSTQFGSESTGPAITLEQVWRQIELLLLRGRHGDAWAAVAAAQGQYGADPKFLDLRAIVTLDVARNSPMDLPPGAVDVAIADASSTVNVFGYTESHVATLIELLDHAGRQAEADAVFGEALLKIANPSASFRLRRFAMMLRKQDWQSVLRAAVELVRASPDDRWLRSEITHHLVDAAVKAYLPITDPERVIGYRMVIDTAAWAAQGVPEAEDFVRPHRMWAANSDQSVFAGSWQKRAMVALLTGFIALPFYNAASAKPAWRLLLLGPASMQNIKRSKRIVMAERAWFLVLNGCVAGAHENVQLPWQSTPNQWPEAQVEFLI